MSTCSLWDFIIKGFDRKQFTPDGSKEETFNESTICRGTDRVKEGCKEWEATQTLARVEAIPP